MEALSPVGGQSPLGPGSESHDRIRRRVPPPPDPKEPAKPRQPSQFPVGPHPPAEQRLKLLGSEGFAPNFFEDAKERPRDGQAGEYRHTNNIGRESVFGHLLRPSNGSQYPHDLAIRKGRSGPDPAARGRLGVSGPSGPPVTAVLARINGCAGLTGVLVALRVADPLVRPVGKPRPVVSSAVPCSRSSKAVRTKWVFPDGDQGRQPRR